MVPLSRTIKKMIFLIKAATDHCDLCFNMQMKRKGITPCTAALQVNSDKDGRRLQITIKDA